MTDSQGGAWVGGLPLWSPREAQKLPTVLRFGWLGSRNSRQFYGSGDLEAETADSSTVRKTWKQKLPTVLRFG